MYPVPRNLKEVAKVPLLMQRDPLTITSLWKQQFERRNDVVTCVIDSQKYKQMTNNAKHSPMFVLPVHVDQLGSYNCVLQFVDNKSVLFTSIDSYKVNGIEKSAPYFIVTIFDELLDNKGIALVRGDIVNQKDVSKTNAQMLLRATVQFYTDLNLYKWVECFNHRSREFDFDEFRRQCQHVLTQNSTTNE